MAKVIRQRYKNWSRFLVVLLATWAMVTSNAEAAFPTVAATNTSEEDAAITTSHTISVPTGIVSGDLLVVFFALDMYNCLWTDSVCSSISWPTGAGAWTQLFYGHEGNDTVLSAAFRIADGTEGTTITVTSVHSDFSAHVSYRITGHHSTTVPEGASFAGQAKTNAPDPPNLDPVSWGAEDTLWLVGIGVDKSSSWVSDPTNYTDPLMVVNTSSSGVWIRTMQRQLNAAAENPGTFSISGSGDEWVSGTIAVRPAAGGDTDPPTPSPMTFASVPNDASATSISMTATTATETISTPVKYLFTYTAGGACGADAGTGGTSSLWDISTTYTDSGLDVNQCYGYTVTAQDSVPNTGTASSPVYVYTAANVPGTPLVSSPTSPRPARPPRPRSSHRPGRNSSRRTPCRSRHRPPQSRIP